MKAVSGLPRMIGCDHERSADHGGQHAGREAHRQLPPELGDLSAARGVLQRHQRFRGLPGRGSSAP